MLGVEKKQELLDMFLLVIQKTKAGEEVVELIYDDSRFAVMVKLKTGYVRSIPVKGESDEVMLSKIFNYLIVF